MDKTVSEEDSVTYNFLDPFTLQPGLPINLVDVTMGPEEGIPHSKLVELYVKVLRGFSKVSWDVSATKEGSRNRVRKELVYGAL